MSEYMALVLRILGDDDQVEIEHVRQFFRNYAAWLGVDLAYQNFGEEMAALPGRYSAPSGRLFRAFGEAMRTRAASRSLLAAE